MAEYPELKFAAVAAEDDGDNVLVAAVAGSKIRVLSYALTVDAAGQLIVKDDEDVVLATLEISGTAEHMGVVYAGSVDAPAFETTAGAALELTNPSSVNTYGHITYIEV